MERVFAPVCPPTNFDSTTLIALQVEDGDVYYGYSFGSSECASGELVFQTGMVGYCESFTDPSYSKQILVMTYPLIGNYGVPDFFEKDEDYAPALLKHFESDKVHISGLVVSHYTDKYSHFLSKTSLSEWLKSNKIPSIYGVDTRTLTKHLREKGTTYGKLRIQKKTSFLNIENLVFDATWSDHFDNIEWKKSDFLNFVDSISSKNINTYKHNSKVLKSSNGDRIVILAIDFGMKYNQIRCLVRRGVILKVVPYNYDFLKEDYDGLFLSNGPGDPSLLTSFISKLKIAVQSEKTPIFGICLGHQLLANAIGLKTNKMKYGNRGQNIPCTSLVSGRCYITSQNHGYVVNVDSMPDGWSELFVNANDSTNEGIYHKTKPFFSVQFHPESNPGPKDTEFLFDSFLNSVVDFKDTKILKAVDFPGGYIEENLKKNPRIKLKKILILGSGGLSIGQAGEFDYSGSQAIKALKEEGIYTILINPNIATIQTSTGLADKVYFLPVNPEFVKKIIIKERPEGIYCTFGGQTALSVGIALKDEFEKLGVKVLGTPIETIIKTEDRDLFVKSLDEINEKYADSFAVNSEEEAIIASKKLGFPLIVRVAYSLGGLGSGFVNNENELIDLCKKSFSVSSQILIEKSMKGWKEVEYEVVRDAFDNCITVCNMENFDPLGIHTGDSIVVAPSQTLSDDDYNMLRDTSINVIRHLGVIGECNIQYALNPSSKQYCIIEVNARLSRSSALASKATGYPLAYVAAKLGLNIPLNKIINSVTKSSCLCFEPSLDYIVIKIPKWDLKKFTRVSSLLSSSMKSVGEMMSIGRTFEEAIQKGIRSTDNSHFGFNNISTLISVEIDSELQRPSDQRLLFIANAFYSGYSVDRVWDLTKIDKWFLYKLEYLIKFGNLISTLHKKEKFSPTFHRQAKQLGFDDRQIAKLLNSNEVNIRRLRIDSGIVPFVKQIDTVAAEFPSETNYLYLTYNAISSDVNFNDNGIIVLGSGAYRIGSSVEFDWCAVRAIRTIQKNNIKTIMINYNPETVSTDYDESDRLYFESITLESILDIYNLEQSSGIVISMGGQESNNIALQLHRQNAKILGTSPEMIDSAENRYKFSRMLDKINIDQPAWKELTSLKEAEEFAEKVTYPVLVRPSYVLSGAAMNIVYSKCDLEIFLTQAGKVSPDHPIVITKYIENAKEIEMDAVAKDGKILTHLISEHVENAGVHSGDATLIYPSQDLDPKTVQRIIEATSRIGKAFDITGPFNIQFIAKNNDIKVIECNIRASRSFPFVSKASGIDLIQLATEAIIGAQIEKQFLQTHEQGSCAVKVSQFSFSRLDGADPVLGVEMASTGEVACFGKNKYEAYLKSLISTGFKLPKKNILFSIGSYKEKHELLPYIEQLSKLGFIIFATSGTFNFIEDHDIPVHFLQFFNDYAEQKDEYSLAKHLSNNLIDLYINLPSSNRYRRPSSYISKGYLSRRMAVNYSIPLITNVKCAKLLFEAIIKIKSLDVTDIDYKTFHKFNIIPGLINILSEFSTLNEIKILNQDALTSGFTCNLFLDKNNVFNSKKIAILHKTMVRDFANLNFYVIAYATKDNWEELLKFSKFYVGIFLSSEFLNELSISIISKIISSFPKEKIIISDAKSNTLSLLLLLCSTFKKPHHVTNINSYNDLFLIKMAKTQNSCVTCDVCIFSLFLKNQDFNIDLIPDQENQTLLRDNIDSIDCFSFGNLLKKSFTCKTNNEIFTLEFSDALIFILGIITENFFTTKDIVDKFYTNPCKIFFLQNQFSTIEIDFDILTQIPNKPIFKIFKRENIQGSIERVCFNGETICLNGRMFYNNDFSADILDDSNLITVENNGFISENYFEDNKKLTIDLNNEHNNHVLKSVLTTTNGFETINDYFTNNPFLKTSILNVNNFTKNSLHTLFEFSQEMKINVEKHGVLDILKGKVLANMFFEPSTRTMISFDCAMQRLGGRVLNFNSSQSSVLKGESLKDTVRTLCSYADLIVLRHPSEDSIYISNKYSTIPIINAGNGSKEHPTQALIDLFTIREELGTVNGVTVTFVGDLKFGRTVHSLCKLLSFYNVKIILVSPIKLKITDEIKELLLSNNMLVTESELLSDEIVARSDVLYCTRFQKERFNDSDEYETLKNLYVIDNNLLAHAKQNMCIMHPFPRNDEISEEVDFDERAAYFRQIKNGLYIRMSLLALVIGIDY